MQQFLGTHLCCLIDRLEPDEPIALAVAAVIISNQFHFYYLAVFLKLFFDIFSSRRPGKVDNTKIFAGMVSSSFGERARVMYLRIENINIR